MNQIINKPSSYLNSIYRPDIDGLRAIAVLAVILFHAFPNRLTGGYVGVDVFFIISGFLISSIISENLINNSFSFKIFYERRVKRIIPTLLIVLYISFLFGWFILLPNEFKLFSKHVLGSTSFISNFLLWNESGYFDTQSNFKPLLHLWSLSIEEQFYLFLPVLLYLIHINFKSIRIYLVLMLLFFSFYFNIKIVNTDPVQAFYSPLTRFWELLVGVAISKFNLIEFLNGRIKFIINLIAIIGLLFIIVSFFIINENSIFPGKIVLLPVVGAVFVLIAGKDAIANKLFLSNSILIKIGLISYPLYLWHWPIFSFARILSNNHLTFLIKLILIVLSIILSVLTKKCIEDPVKKIFFGKYQISFILFLFFLLIPFAFYSYYVDGLNVRNNNNIIASNIYSATNDWDEITNDKNVIITSDHSKQYISNPKSYTLLIGDSHAEQYFPRIKYLKETTKNHSNSTIFLTKLGNIPIRKVRHSNPNINLQLSNDEKKFWNYLNNILLQNYNITDVVLSFSWSSYFTNDYLGYENNSNKELYFEINEHKIFLNDLNNSSQILFSFISEIKEVVGDSVRFTIILDNPIGDNFNPLRSLKGNRIQGLNIVKTEKYTNITKSQLKLNKLMQDFANNNKINVINPLKTLCNQNYSCLILDNDGKPIYKDSDHIRASFVSKNANYIDNLFIKNLK